MSLKNAHAPLQPLHEIQEYLLHLLHPLPLRVSGDVEHQQLSSVHVAVVRVHNALVKQVLGEVVHVQV